MNKRQSLLMDNGIHLKDNDERKTALPARTTKQPSPFTEHVLIVPPKSVKRVQKQFSPMQENQKNNAR
jgi:hypothetical protein